MKKEEHIIEKKHVIALAGNPNVGKSTVFNALTGLKQHTGNWPGKTVSNASGDCEYKGKTYEFFDLPGTYSLIAHSKEEEVARDFICFGNHDAVLVVCDAVCLERNLNLVLQTLEITNHVVVCVNLLDEAKKKHITVDLDKLATILKVPVVGTSAREKKGLDVLLDTLEETLKKQDSTSREIAYPAALKTAIAIVEKAIRPFLPTSRLNTNWIALQLLLAEEDLKNELVAYLNVDLFAQEAVKKAVEAARMNLLKGDIVESELKDVVVSSIVHQAEEIGKRVVTFEKADYAKRDRKIDRFLTSKWTGIPVMVLLLMLVFWITITGANYPTEILFQFFAWIEKLLQQLFTFLMAPSWLYNMLVLGVYRVLSWVVAVMLPPMAIFFPLFTLLEDLGYLPRIAFNLDRCFKKCCACGKQALTMCMGFGCNAAGVVGCRIIDSPRERLIAILTNNLVPCNGRYPMIIAILTMFFVGFHNSLGTSLLNVLLLTSVILLGIIMTFALSKFLSKTILKGVPSSFTLELPPYRKPQIVKTIVRSIFDRTLYVLGRAVMIAAPAGLLIWLLSNVQVGGASILSYCTTFFDPFARIIGLDGAILMAFILGFPANEIVIPIIMMIYMASGNLTDYDSLQTLKTLFVDNGWTWLTAACTILFSLFHFPCSTTCLTIKKETGSWKWTALAFILPTIIGIGICFLLTTVVRLFHFV